MIPELIIFVSRGITVIASQTVGDHMCVYETGLVGNHVSANEGFG